ncbi:sugar transferase [Funiculus sociatus GB2-A5]|uniref:Sugar transferase n=1 Tax=Funiculus sociatus GB2-A5 TaxID=2933946 RepID=A0ABV0JPI1_9CYAN|nr:MULTISPECIES: Npun_R2821/Npun_R2822 family protein [unclassified Trichocoleus]MBD1907540.1 sugar transferase [Trichocoleus sp. FACHB-832]MBD2062130.1 sugar transferase [Trichocoleus sp. FACHB-6]
MNGICTLGNDRVYDQIVALLNSIEVVLGPETPVCIYPFDEHTEMISAEISKRPNVFLYDDTESIQRWDEFMQRVRPDKMDRSKRLYGAHRRFCAFDGPFDKFIYMDADTLVMKSLDFVFDKLDEYNCVVYDFQYVQPEYVYNIKSKKLLEVFNKEKINKEIFCSGFYGSKRGVFSQEQRDWLISQLQAGESEIFKPGGHDQPVINYMFMRSGIPIYNFAHHWTESEVTGCTVTSKQFEEKDNILYDKGKRLTYIHYIGISPRVPAAVCAGENIDFPYRDIFLHYRYLHEPEKRPVFTGVPVPYNYKPRPSLMKRVLNKLKLTR